MKVCQAGHFHPMPMHTRPTAAASPPTFPQAAVPPSLAACLLLAQCNVVVGASSPRALAAQAQTTPVAHAGGRVGIEDGEAEMHGA